MRLQQLVEASTTVAGTRSRLLKTATLADLLKQMRGSEIRIAVSYLSGSLTQGRIGLGWTAVAGARAAGAAEHPSLELVGVDSVFETIAHASGPGVARVRMELLTELLTRATPDEQDFLIRLISGELRQGALEGVLAEAIAKAANTPADSVRQAAMMCGSLGEVACTALTEGGAALSHYAIQLFRPVEPMLASPAENVAEALEWLHEAAFELKLDGARIQIHKSGNDVKVFSRGLRDVTAAVPEVVEHIRPLSTRELILDGEVIALGQNGRPHPFQETMRRFGRKLQVDELRRELPLTPFCFDCLYVDGRAMTP